MTAIMVFFIIRIHLTPIMVLRNSLEEVILFLDYWLSTIPRLLNNVFCGLILIRSYKSRYITFLCKEGDI